MNRFLFGHYVEGDIRDHISKDSPEAARRLMVRFLAAFRTLARRPGLGQVREDLRVPELRFWSVGPYLLIYRAEKQPIDIVAVVRGARNVPILVPILVCRFW